MPFSCGQRSLLLLWLSGFLSLHLLADAALQRKANSQLNLQLRKSQSKAFAQEKVTSKSSSEDSEDSEDEDDDDSNSANHFGPAAPATKDVAEPVKKDSEDEDDDDSNSANHFGPAAPAKKDVAEPVKKDHTSVMIQNTDEMDIEKEVQKALQDSLRVSENSAAVIVDSPTNGSRKAAPRINLIRAQVAKSNNSENGDDDVEEAIMENSKSDGMNPKDLDPTDPSLQEAFEAVKEVDASLSPKGSAAPKHRHKEVARVVSLKKRRLRKKEEDVEREIDPHEREKARMLEKIKAIEQELAENLQRQKTLKHRLEHLQNQPKSDEEIDSTAQKAAEETQSPDMANMLGGMWKELRMFEVPFYAPHVNEELQALKRGEKVLEEKLTAAQARYSEHRERWDIEASGNRGDLVDRVRRAERNAEDRVRRAEDRVYRAEKKAEDKTWSYSNAVTRDVSQFADDMNLGSPSLPKPHPIIGETLEKIWMNYDTYNNFWDMNWEDQKTVLRHTLVQILFGLACAVLYVYARDKYEGIFDPDSSRGVGYGLTNSREFKFPLFGCFRDLKTCVLGFCCPCLRWSDTVDRQLAASNGWTYWKAFAFMFVLMILNPFTAGLSSFGIVILGVIIRQALRRSFNMEHSTPKTFCLDFGTWLCCQPCAICQEAREQAARQPKLASDA